MKKLLIVVLMLSFMMTGCAGQSRESDLNGAAGADRPAMTEPSKNQSDQSAAYTNTDNSIISDDEILELSRNLYPDEFQIMDEYDIDESQKLAIILIANYLDMQVRIDVEGIEQLNPQFKEALEGEDIRSDFIHDLLQCSEFQLQAVEEANLKNALLTFHVAYQYRYGEDNLSMLFREFTYRWKDGRWIYEGDTDADPVASQKPNFFLFLDKKEQASAEMFGTDNLLTLFGFSGESYRESYGD